MSHAVFVNASFALLLPATRYGEYMRAHGFRWALIVLFEQRPTRLAMRAAAALLPTMFLEFVLSGDIIDWTGDRDGVDVGPRWEGDLGVRGEAEMERRAKARETAAAALAARIAAEKAKEEQSARLARRNKGGRPRIL
jgi:hypothetical protein